LRSASCPSCVFQAFQPSPGSSKRPSLWVTAGKESPHSPMDRRAVWLVPPRPCHCARCHLQTADSSRTHRSGCPRSRRCRGWTRSTPGGVGIRKKPPMLQMTIRENRALVNGSVECIGRPHLGDNAERIATNRHNERGEHGSTSKKRPLGHSPPSRALTCSRTSSRAWPGPGSGLVQNTAASSMGALFYSTNHRRSGDEARRRPKPKPETGGDRPTAFRGNEFCEESSFIYIM